MKPLHAVAMGLLIVLLTAPVAGFDLLPDPVGWALVLVGLRTLPVAQRRPLQQLAALCLVVAAVVWVPGVSRALAHADPSLTWAASLPQLVTLVLLVHALAQQALLAGDRAARGWLLTVRTLLVLVALLPVVVLGGHLDALRGALALAGSLTLLLLVVLLFAWSSRPWALPVPASEDASVG